MALTFRRFGSRKSAAVFRNPLIKTPRNVSIETPRKFSIKTRPAKKPADANPIVMLVPSMLEPCVQPVSQVFMWFFWDIDRVIRRFWGIWGGLVFTTAGILLFSSSRIRGNHSGFMSRLGWLMWFLDIDMYVSATYFLLNDGECPTCWFS